MNKEKAYSIEELEIDFRDLILQIMKHWRFLCICAAVAAVLGGAFGYVKSIREAEIEDLNEQWSVADISEKEKKLVEKKRNVIEAFEKSYEHYENYLETAAKMQLNSNGYYKGILSYVISADDTAEAGVVCRMYEESLKKEEIFEKISEMTAEGKKAKYYEELLEISEILGDSAAKTEISVEADKMAVFTVAFSHNDEQMCRAVLSFLEEKISRVSEEITSAKEGHELLLFSKDIAVMDNKEIVSKKQQIAQEQINILNQISNIENGMSEEQASYYRMIKNGENGSEGQEETAQTVPEINFKYMIFGMSAGGILAAAWLAFFYIADRRLHTKTDVYVLTDEKVLAVCTVPDNKKRIFSGIDNAIKKMISKRDGFGNSSEMLEFQLEEYARRTKIQELYLVGSRMNCDDDCIRFVEQLNPKGISLKSAQNFLENVTERKAVIENGHAVLIEMIGRTECSALQEETGVLADYGVNLAGIVLLR